jgi:outer membrane protein TolC
MRDQARAGYVSQLELRQSEAEYQATVKLLPQTQLAITRQENALNVLIGTSPGPSSAVRHLQRCIQLRSPTDFHRRSFVGVQMSLRRRQRWLQPTLRLPLRARSSCHPSA